MGSPHPQCQELAIIESVVSQTCANGTWAAPQATEGNGRGESDLSTAQHGGGCLLEAEMGSGERGEEKWGQGRAGGKLEVKGV